MPATHRHPARPAKPAAQERDRGSSTIEAVIIMPAVIVLTMILVQAVLLWHGRHVAQSAAQAAAIAAAGFQATAQQGRDACTGYLRAVAPNLLAGAGCLVDRAGLRVIATVDATLFSVVPFAHPHVHETAAAQIESIPGGTR